MPQQRIPRRGRRDSTAFAAVPGEIGAQDMSGPYSAADWPKDLSTLPGHEKWTWGAAQGIFAESPNRVFLLARGELPNIPRPADTRAARSIGPSVQFPVGGLPWRNAHAAALPGAGGTGQDPGEGDGDLARRRRRRIASSASTPAGSTASSSSTRRATSSKSGRSGTRCSSARTPSTSARTTRRSTSGSSTTTRTRSTSSPTTASSWCRRSARPNVPGADAHALQPADVHGLAARRQLLRRRRLQRHARREVRQGRQVPAATGA